MKTAEFMAKHGITTCWKCGGSEGPFWFSGLSRKHGAWAECKNCNKARRRNAAHRELHRRPW